MGKVGIAHQRADAHTAIGQILDPVEAGKTRDVDEPLWLHHATLHQIHKICAGGEIGTPGRGGGADSFVNRRRPDIIEALHATSFRLAASRVRWAVSTASVIP